VSATACVTIDGRPHVVTGARDDTLRVWNLADGAQRAVLTGHSGTSWGGGPALACTTIDGRPHAVTGAPDQTVRVWDLTHGVQRSLRTGHTNTVNAVACVTIDGRPHAVTGGGDKTVRLWDLTDEAKPELVVRVSYDWATGPYGLACAHVDGRPHAFVAGGGNHRTVHVVDLTDGTKPTPLICSSGGVSTLACTDIGGSPHLLMCGAGLEVWDLARGVQRAALTPEGRVYDVSCAPVDGRPFAVTTGEGRTVQLWDLETNELVESITLPLDGKSVASTGAEIVVAMADEVVVFVRETGCSRELPRT
jgi:WD40 repeat protein